MVFDNTPFAPFHSLAGGYFLYFLIASSRTGCHGLGHVYGVLVIGYDTFFCVPSGVLASVSSNLTFLQTADSLVFFQAVAWMAGGCNGKSTVH